MKTPMVLWLLITVYTYSIACSKDEDVNKDQEIYNTLKAQSNIRSAMKELMFTNIDRLIKMRTFIIYARLKVRADFHASLVTEINNTRAAVDAAIAKGKDAEHCFTNAVNNFKKIQELAELQFAACANASFEDFVNRLSIIGRFHKQAEAIILKISLAFITCYNEMKDSSHCLNNLIKKSKTYNDTFEEKMQWFPAYQKLISEKVAYDILLCLNGQFNKGMKKVTEIKAIYQICAEGAE